MECTYNRKRTADISTFQEKKKAAELQCSGFPERDTSDNGEALQIKYYVAPPNENADSDSKLPINLIVLTFFNNLLL